MLRHQLRTGLNLCAALSILALVLSGCGPLGDDDNEKPTPTLSVTVPGARTPALTIASSPPAARTATPRSAAEEPKPSPTRASARPTRTPTPPSASDEGTPEADGTAEDESSSSNEDVEPTKVVVEDCEEPETLPERTGRVSFVVSEDGLNLRTAPGTSCDAITTLTAGTPVKVISGVVEADDIDWVKIQVDDLEGWVSTEFLDVPES